MTFRVDLVLSRLVAALDSVGVTTSAQALARALLIADLGGGAHGKVLEGVLADIDSIRSSRRKPKLTIAEGGGRVLDGAGLPVCALADLMVESSRARVAEAGMSALAIRRTAGMSKVGIWARVLADSGLVALVFWKGGTRLVVPAGSREPVFGTNPVAFGIPTDGDPIVGDLATSQVTYRGFLASRGSGRTYPTPIGLGPDGEPSSDPDGVAAGPDWARLLPIGGAKGSSISLLTEILTGGFVGAAMGLQLTPGHHAEEHGGLVLTFSPSLFTDRASFLEDVGSLAAEIRGSAAARPGTPVRLPGDRGIQALAQARKSGVDVRSAAVVTWLNAPEEEHRD